MSYALKDSEQKNLENLLLQAAGVLLLMVGIFVNGLLLADVQVYCLSGRGECFKYLQ